jgi:hypothetical protein
MGLEGYNLSEIYALMDARLIRFYRAMLGNNIKPETVTYLMESHHHERLKMVSGDKYNAMRQHVGK